MKIRYATLLLPVSLTALLWGCDVDQTQEGKLPEVDVDIKAGQMPEYDVDTPDVDIGTKEAEVKVPDVDVEMKKKTITVPDVDVEMPENDGE